MTAEKFLTKFFSKLSAKDFKKDKFLCAFYKFYKKEQNGDLFECYIEYLTRNKQYVDENEREVELGNLYSELQYAILNGIKTKQAALGFVGEKDKNKAVKLEDLDGQDNFSDDDKDDNTDEIKTSRNLASTKPLAYNSTVMKPTTKPAVMKPTTKPAVMKPTTKPAVMKPALDKTVKFAVAKSEVIKAPISKRAVKSSDGKKVQLNKESALHVLSMFIKQSCIVTYEEPDQELTQEDQEFRENTTDSILDEIVHGKVSYDHEGTKITEEARVLPEAKKDVVFGQRSDMMNVWHDTEAKCQNLIKNERLASLVYKIYFINTVNTSNARNDDAEYDRDKSIRKEATASVDGSASGSVNILSKPKKIETVFLEEIKELLPIEKFVSCYTNTKYNTIYTFVNNQPVTETLTRATKKLKPIYICAGSQMVLGGNADQGIDTIESMLWMTTTYSSALEKALHAYPLYANQLIICPNVLVFKNTSYTTMPVPDWQKIAVMNAPCRFRPAVIIKDPEKHTVLSRLYDKSTKFEKKSDMLKFEQSLTGAIETALFFGYDTIVLDDRGIEDNWLPAHSTAKLMKQVMLSFEGRVKEFVIAIDRAKSFNVFRHYFA